MTQDIIDQVESFRTNESGALAKLASTVQWRRLVLLLLREIVVELRALNLSRHPPQGPGR